MIYFDNAATSYPKPRQVKKSMFDGFDLYTANVGRGSHQFSLDSNRKIYEVRSLVSDFVDSDNLDGVIFTKNGTESLNVGIKGVLRQGDHVITTEMEHNSVLRPLYKLNKEGYIDLTIIQFSYNNKEIEKRIEESIRKKTKMIIVNHVSNVNGHVINIKNIGDICRDKDIIFMVDAAQSMGRYNISMKKDNIDILAAPGHKGLMGPQGTGILCLTNKVKEKIDSLIEGGTGSSSQLLEQPNFFPDKLESGTINNLGIIGLGSGISYIEEKGIEKLKEKEELLSKFFINGVKRLKGYQIYTNDLKKYSSVVSINHKNLKSTELSYILDRKYKIYTRSGLHCAPLIHRRLGTIKKGTTRFSFGIFNTKDEVKYALEKLKDISEQYN